LIDQIRGNKFAWQKNRHGRKIVAEESRQAKSRQQNDNKNHGSKTTQQIVDSKIAAEESW
jgi:hypothetical protein